MTLPGVSEELTALLTLRFTPGLGPLRTEAVRAHFGSASAALTAPREALRGVPGLGARTASLIGAREAHEKARAEVRDAASCGVTLLGRGLDGYPGALEALPDPPAVLWVKGALPALGPVPKAVGIVGTRKASPHGLQFARCLAQDLARAGVIIVSGMARGVDTAAHAAAVKERAPTIGVLGSGVDVTNPVMMRNASYCAPAGRISISTRPSACTLARNPTARASSSRSSSSSASRSARRAAARFTRGT